MYVGKATPEEVGDVKGKIVLAERGDIAFVDKIKNVLEKGAVGVLMYNNSDEGNTFGQAAEGQNIQREAESKHRVLETHPLHLWQRDNKDLC